MDEVRAMNKIGVNLSQEKMDFTNDTHQKELKYWKKVALESVLTENGRKQLTDLTPPKGFLARNTAIKNVKNVYEIIFYLKSQHSTYHEKQRTFIPDISSQENILSFEAITDYLKTFSKSIKDENMVLKNKTFYSVVGYQLQRKYTDMIKLWER